MRMRTLAAMATAAALLGSLSACTTTNPSPNPDLQPGTVVATGTLASWDDSVTGDVRVTVSPKGDFDFTFPNLTSGAKRGLQVVLAMRPISVTTRCLADEEPTFPLDESASRTKPSVLPGDKRLLPLGDPSFIHEVAISQANTDLPSCTTPVWAVAKLHWHIPDPDPKLKVVDSGSTGGATGIVTYKNGQPYSYRVVANDLPKEVDARLGLTAAQMFYLNPEFGEPDSYEIGQVINLNRANR